MQNVFNPMQSVNAFAVGQQIGGGLRDNQTKNAFSEMIGKKNYQGARDYAYARGNPDLGMGADGLIAQMDEQSRSQALQRAETLARSAMKLKGITNPVERDETYSRMIPDLLQSGLPEDQLRAFNPLDDAALQGVIDKVTPFEDLRKAQAGPEYFAPVQTEQGYAQFSKDGVAPKTFDGIRPPAEPQGPESPIGRIMADYNAGLIDEETANAAIARANAPRQPLVQNTINPEAPPLPTNKTLTPLQQKMDDEYAGLLVKWNIGGAGDAVKQLDQLGEVANRLESGENITGWVLGSMPDLVLAGLNPESMDTKELVQEVVQRGLRETLGAQFTEKEGEMLLARAYNPRLDEQRNAARLRRLISTVEARAQQLNSLNEYMQRNGTSAGWDGSLMSANQILADMDSVSGGANTPEANQKRLVFNPATGEFE